MNISHTTTNPSDIKILVVDDEAPIRNVIKRILESQEYKCDTASSAREATEKLKEKEYSLVVTDIMMPEMSGMEFLELLRKRDDEIAVIMLTALMDIDVSIQALKAGAYDYITKPFRNEDVLISVEMALQKRNLILENRDYQRNLEKRVKEQSQKIQSSFIKSIESLARTLEAKDPETRDHSRRVTDYSVRTAETMGVNRAG